MPVGDVERAVALAAAAEGIALQSMPRVEWLNTHGHFALPDAARPAIPALQRAFEALGGDEAEHRSKRYGRLPSDLFHAASRTMVEVDELQHFTSFRQLTLEELTADPHRDLYEHYRALCLSFGPRADKYRASKTAKGFPGAFGRGRQRAYNDLLRDLVAPLMGYSLIRVPAANLSGAEAFAASSTMFDRLRESGTVASRLGQ